MTKQNEEYDPETTPFKASNDISNDETFFFVGEEDLSKDIEDVLAKNDLNHEFKCNIVLFTYNTNLIMPFIQFALFLQNNVYNFINFNITNEIFDKKREELTISDSAFDYYDYFEKLVSDSLKENIQNDNIYENKGFFKIENQIFVFLMINDNSIKLNTELTYNWCISDEIMSYKHINNISIHKDVFHIFDTNNKFMYIKNNNNELLDIPILTFNHYLNNKDDDDKKTTIELKEDTDDILIEPDNILTKYGKRFVFSSSFSLSNDKKYTKFALFRGECYYIFNNDDPSDDIINKDNNISKEYDNYDTIYITDINNNGYYLVRSIDDFTKL